MAYIPLSKLKNEGGRASGYVPLSRVQVQTPAPQAPKAENKGIVGGIKSFLQDANLARRVIGARVAQKDIEISPGVKAGFPDAPIGIKDVARSVPGAIVPAVKATPETFAPALTEFTKTSGGIIGEGLAYALDPLVREQYKAGNVEILPLVTKTTQADIAKKTIAAGIESAIFRSFPKALQQNITKRGGIGALEGLGFAVSEGLAKDYSPEEIVKNAALYGAFGSVANIALPSVMQAIKREISLFKKAPQEAKEILQEIANVPQTRKLAVDASEDVAENIPLERTPVLDIEGRSNIPVRPSVVDIDTPNVTSEVPVISPNISEETLGVAEEVLPQTRVTKVSNQQLPVGTGETRVSRLEARLKGVLDKVDPAKAEAEGITTFQQMNKADQRRKASRFVEKSSDEEIMAILRGDQEAPPGLLHNAIAMAAEQKASLARDANLALKLASARSSRAGQEISILSEADPLNPVTQIDEILKARARKAQRKLKSGDTPERAVSRAEKEAVKDVRKTRLKIEEAENLLKSILC